MSIVLLGSTSGSITLQEPAVAGSNTISLPAATGTVALTSGFVLTQSFTSTNQAIPTASGQTFTVAHGLGVVPKILRLVAVCLTATSGWTVGAEGQIIVSGTSNGNINFEPQFADAINVYYGAGSSMLVLNFSTGDFLNILNNANFAVKIYAFA